MITIFNGRKRSLDGGSNSVWMQVDVLLKEHMHLFNTGKTVNSWGVFTIIALHANENGWAWPGTETIMRQLGFKDADTVSAALSHLRHTHIDGHVILRHWRVKEKGQWGRSYYHIFPDAGGEDQFPVANLVPWNPEPSPAKPTVAFADPVKQGDSTIPNKEPEIIPPTKVADQRVVVPTTFRHVKVSSDAVATDIDKANKPERKKTALELRILTALPGQKGVPKIFDKLAETVFTTVGTLESPNDLFDREPLFRQWIEGKIGYWQTQKSDVKHLISLIRQYDGTPFSWVKYYGTYIESQAASDKKEAEIKQEISKIDGVKDVPTWAQNPDEIPDDIFGEE